MYHDPSATPMTGEASMMFAESPPYRCDVCGRFAGSKGQYLNDLWQPDYWNGPRITFYCPHCYKKEVKKRAKY